MNNYPKYPEEVSSGKLKMVDIEGFEDLYGIAEDGRGWRYPTPSLKGRWLSPKLNSKCDYPVYVLHIRRFKKYSTRAICKIVAKAFNDNPHEFTKVKFIDGDIHNPHKDNIKWIPSGKMCIVEGKVFESEFKAYSFYGVPKAVFKNRRHLGWTVDESLGLKKRKYDFNNLSGFIYLITDKTNGKKYVGQTKTTINKRLKHHFEASRITKGINKNGLMYAIKMKNKDDFEISILDEIKDINDLNEREVFYIGKLNTLTPNGYNLNAGGGGARYAVKVEYNGKKYSGNADIARVHNIDPATFQGRLNKGNTIDQALGKEPVVNSVVYAKRDVEYDGIKYSSVTKLAKALNIPRTTLTARLNREMSIKDAVEYIPDAPKLSEATPVEIAGVKYKSKGEAARAHNIKVSIFVKRLREGWDIESAAGIKPRLLWYDNS